MYLEDGPSIRVWRIDDCERAATQSGHVQATSASRFIISIVEA